MPIFGDSSISGKHGAFFWERNVPTAKLMITLYLSDLHTVFDSYTAPTNQALFTELMTMEVVMPSIPNSN